MRKPRAVAEALGPAQFCRTGECPIVVDVIAELRRVYVYNPTSRTQCLVLHHSGGPCSREYGCQSLNSDVHVDDSSTGSWKVVLACCDAWTQGVRAGW